MKEWINIHTNHPDRRNQMWGVYCWRECNVYPPPSVTAYWKEKERMDHELGVRVVLMDQLCKSLTVLLRGRTDSFLETLVFQ